MNTHLLSRLPVRAIGIMEDDEEWLNTIESELCAYGAGVCVAHNEEEVVELAKQRGVRIFILDVNMGPGTRAQEGLNALERLKAYDPGILVCVLSGYRDFRRQAQKLHVDHFEEKTGDRSANISRSLHALLSRAGREFGCAAKKLASKGDPTGNLFDDPPADPLADSNYTALAKLREDAEWVSEHVGCYVALVDGQLVGSSDSRVDLLSAIRRAHAGKRRYVTQVVNEEVVEDLPSPEVVDDN
jgi:ActR/RegA family two-component response regulator